MSSVTPPIHADGSANAALPAAQKTDEEPQAKTQNGAVFDAALIAADIGKGLGRGWRQESFIASLDALGTSPSTVIAAAAASLAQGNLSTAEAAWRDRMALIDFLGVAAKHHASARRQLFAFALSDVPSQADVQMQHLDVTDRLEAFVYVAALAPNVAARHVRKQPGKGFKSRFIVQYVAGRVYGGATRESAIEDAYQRFGTDPDLAFARPQRSLEDL